MCGIVGAVSTRDMTRILLEGLRRLEYRGYDSAGIALIDDNSQLKRERVPGKVQALVDLVQRTAISGNIGVAHTRWATHGKPTTENAHPHLSHEKIALVHNGIIENYEALRERLQGLDYHFVTETDTEVAVHLIYYHYQKEKNLLCAVQKAAKEMQGAFALGVLHTDHPDELVAIRKGCPLVVGLGMGEHFIASDTLALSSFAHAVVYLEEGDSVLLKANSYDIFNANGEVVEREVHPLYATQETVSKGSYRHFMLKEIYEQPAVLARALEGRISSINTVLSSFGAYATDIFPKVSHIHIVACGTSYHAGMVARYWLESLTGKPTQVEIASEYRYRDIVVPPDTLFIAVSQSGETADTLAALSKAKSKNYLATLAICNVASSSIVRESDCVFLTRAGVEIGVASTKAFTTQLAAFLMLSIALGRDNSRTQEVLAQLRDLPLACEKALRTDKQIEAISSNFVNKAHALFLGRGVHYPVALEGALKLKEISYIHAEAYPAGELKHGPLALVDNSMPVIAIAPENELLDKVKSNIQEVITRGGQLFIFADEGHNELSYGAATIIPVPSAGHWISPIIYTLPLQLLAYHVAVAKGTDVDQPRNLAKSVTVE